MTRGTQRESFGMTEMSLDLPPEDVPGIDQLMVELAAGHGLTLLRKISRQITGMATTMRSEFIVMLQKA
jgi:hypothetical protein